MDSTTKSAAAALGKLGGSVRSEAKKPRFVELLALAEARAIDRRDWLRRTRIYRIRRRAEALAAMHKLLERRRLAKADRMGW